MADLFASGRIVDIVLALVALEAAALLAWRRRRGHGPSPLALLANLASGAALMLAVRAALAGSDWTTVAGFLLAALVAHITDLCRRFREEQPEAERRRTTVERRGNIAGDRDVQSAASGWNDFILNRPTVRRSDSWPVAPHSRSDC